MSDHAMYEADCPRCGQSMTTFDILANTYVHEIGGSSERWECFLQCRKCGKPSIALLAKQAHANGGPASQDGKFANYVFRLESWVFEVPGRRKCPEYVPDHVRRVFEEAATCSAVGAWDAAGTMFRKVLDVATRSITPRPDSNVEPRPSNWKTFKDLRLRLDWLFAQGLLSSALKDLSSCIHEDGNDAAHDAAGISHDEAEDLGDFSENVLETLYTLPGQIVENRRRREARRGTEVD